LKEILNSSNKKYQSCGNKSFSCKINYAEVQIKQIGPEVGVSFKRETDSDSGPKPGLQGIRLTPHPSWLHTEINVRHRELNPDVTSNVTKRIKEIKVTS